MRYYELIRVYNEIRSKSGRLDKVEIISKFIKNLKDDELKEIIYLLQGKVFADNDSRKTGVNEKIVIKALSIISGENEKEIEKIWSKKGDLGEISEELIKKKKQSALFEKKLDVEKVVNNIKKLSESIGDGAVNRKLQLINELLSNCNGEEAKYITRTLLENMRIGIQDGVIRDSIAQAFDKKVEDIQKANDLLNDYGEVAIKAKNNDLENIDLKIGKPVKVMLAVIFTSVEESFEALGEKVQVEEKLDGFRVIIHKDKNVKLFTRNLEDVTNQFPDVVETIKEIKEDKFILDSEVVGYDKKTGKYLPFQNISIRIKRKYDIEKMQEEYPVEINVFDILYYKKNLMDNTLKERREVLEKIIKEKKGKIKLTKKIISDNKKEIEKFFENALKNGREGIMVKNLDSLYKPGRYVNGWGKLKKILEPLDLVIVKAEYGTGKRAGSLTSFTLSCKDKDNYLEVGKVSTGVKEKDDELTYAELTKLLKPLIIREHEKMIDVKPKIILEIGYEEIQKSSAYTSGYALRFPRVLRLRNDKDLNEINTIKDVEKIYNSQTKIR